MKLWDKGLIIIIIVAVIVVVRTNDEIHCEPLWWQWILH
jgi:hypothetical protein